MNCPTNECNPDAYKNLGPKRKTQNAKQKLSSERNWALLSLRSAESNLQTVRKLFPNVDVSVAVREVQSLLGQLDHDWKCRRLAITENEIDPS